MRLKFKSNKILFVLKKKMKVEQKNLIRGDFYFNNLLESQLKEETFG